MPIPGVHLAQLNYLNRNFILFELVPSTIEFADILVELLEHMKRAIDITTHLILVVGREAEALPLFQELDRRDIYFIVIITQHSKATVEMARIPKSDFNEDFQDRENIVEELKNIDLETEFFQLNPASTTFSIAVHEAVTNADSELTKRVSHDGRPMKVNRAKKVLYRLPGVITVGSSTKIVALAPIRNRPPLTRIECLCSWLTGKEAKDTDGKRLCFKIENT